MKLDKSYYVGKGAYYGGSSELAMMKEIRARGPIVADFDVPLGFSVYKAGILSEPGAEKFKENLKAHISTRTLLDYDIMWEYINHSIMIVGWGEDEKGTKFWLCRNSYGTWFGEDHGHFRIRRGQNDFGLES